MTQSTQIFDTDLHRFQHDVLEASRKQPILVDFWAEWCGPCKVLDPVMQRVLPEYAGRVRLAKLEVDEDDNMKLAGHYRVRGFPTVLLFIDAVEVARFTSAQPAQVIRDFLDQHLPS